MEIAWDIGAIYYSYPGRNRPSGGYNIDSFEGALKASKVIDTVIVVGGAYVSPDFFGQSGTGVYLEGGADVALPLGFTASGRFGDQWIEHEPRFGTPDYATWSVSISREVAASRWRSVTTAPTFPRASAPAARRSGWLPRVSDVFSYELSSQPQAATAQRCRSPGVAACLAPTGRHWLQGGGVMALVTQIGRHALSGRSLSWSPWYHSSPGRGLELPALQEARSGNYYPRISVFFQRRSPLDLLSLTQTCRLVPSRTMIRGPARVNCTRVLGGGSRPSRCCAHKASSSRS